MKTRPLKYFLTALLAICLLSNTSAQEVSQKQKYDSLLSQAMRESAQKNTASSNILFKECIALYPNEPAPYFELAKNYDNTGDSKQAVYYAKRAYTLAPTNLWYEEFLFSIGARYKDTNTLTDILYTRFKRDNAPIDDLLALYMSCSNTESALSLVKEYETKNGRNTKTISYLADVYSQLKDYKKALSQVNELCKKEPESAIYTLQKAYILTQLGREKEGWKLVENFYASHPQNGEAAAALLPLYQQQGRYDDLFNAVSVVMSDPKIDIKERTQILLSAVSVSNELKKYDDSVEKSLLKLLENSQNYPALDAYASQFFSNKKDSIRAFEYLRKAVKGGYDDESIALALLYEEAAKKQYEILLEDGAFVTSRYPKNPHAWYIYSYAAQELKHYDTAIKALEEAKKLSQSVSVAFYAEICSILGSYYDQAKNHQKADENFNAALSLDSDNATTLNNFAYSLATRASHDLQKAKNLAEQALKLAPDKSYIMDTYAWILYLLKDYKNALVYIEKAFELSAEQSIEVCQHYREILLANSMKDRADQINKKIEELKSENK